LVPFGSGAVSVDWSAAEETEIAPENLVKSPAGPATFAALPPTAAKAASYASWLKDYGRALLDTESLTLLTDESTGLLSRAGEAEGAFRARVQLAARETRDAAKDRLRQKYAPKIAALDERIRRAEQALSREQSQSSQSMIETGLSIGATVLGALMGRKTFSASTIGRATTAARGVGRSMKESQDVGRASENIAELKAQRAEIDANIESEIQGLEAGAPAPDRSFARLEIKPKKTQVTPERIVLVWRA